METMWRVTLVNGDFRVKFVWRFSGVFMEKTFLIKSTDNLHFNFAI